MTTTSHALWHPFADMGSVDGDRMVLTRAEGPRVWVTADAAISTARPPSGTQTSGTDATRSPTRSDASWRRSTPTASSATSRTSRRSSSPTASLPWAGAGSRVFLGSGGGDMIETAAKLARSYHAHNGEPRRVHLIGRVGGHHGTHGVGTSVGGIAANADGFGPLVPDVSSVPHDDVHALEAEILRVGADRVAAFFCEPVIGAGGVHLPPAGYIEGAVEVCARYGVLFVAECVICGFGRLGTWFGIDRWPVRPDLIVVAKGSRAAPCRSGR
jgi:putrescine---pyruvate transaminase